MIPILLRLRNFMSYGDEPVEIDFTGWRMACLSGNNGHGKSAIFDALTWAVWGKCRVQREDDVVRQGARETDVEYEFELGDSRYRIIRKRALRKTSGLTTLEFQVWDGSHFRPNTADSVSATEERIATTLKLTYDIFINSAFLRQGHADEFTDKTPGERKRVLATILGLQHYDVLRDAANQRSKECLARAQDLAYRLVEIARIVEGMPDLQEQWDRLTEQVEQKQGVLDNAEAEVRRLDLRQAELKPLQSHAARIQIRIQQYAIEQHQRDTRRTKIASDLQAASRVIASEHEILAGYAGLQRIRHTLETLQEQAEKDAHLGREAMALQNTIDKEVTHRKAVITQHNDWIKQLGREVQDIPQIERRLAATQAEATKAATIEMERQHVIKQREEATAERTRLDASVTNIEKEMDKLRNQLRLLQQAGATCPVCQSPLSSTQQAELEQEYRRDGLHKKEEVAAAKAQIAILTDRIEQLTAQETACVARLAEANKQAQLAASMQERLATLQGKQAELLTLERKLHDMTCDLERAEFLSTERTRLAQLAIEKATLGYDDMMHRAARKKVTELAIFEEKKIELEKAQSQKVMAEESLHDLDNQDCQASQTRQQEQEQLDFLTPQLAAASSLALALQKAQAEYTTLNTEIKAHQKDLSDVLSKINEAARAATERLSVQNAHDTLLFERGVYDELTLAFGRQGIQAMIIDGAVPEIEVLTNELLALMSDNSIHVQLATQRQTQKGDMRETLDINISDTLGTRPYELFSGGEAFRINFALRVAISQLLAERAGARLQTLIIDEGFGTQDGQGRERLVEAINSISQRFDKIIVITHLDELKDAFPTRLEVTKGINGSQVTIVAD